MGRQIATAQGVKAAWNNLAHPLPAAPDAVTRRDAGATRSDEAEPSRPVRPLEVCGEQSNGRHEAGQHPTEAVRRLTRSTSEGRHIY